MFSSNKKTNLNLVTLLGCDSVNSFRHSCYKPRKHFKLAAIALFILSKRKSFCLKQNNRVWFGFVIIAAHFFYPLL